MLERVSCRIIKLREVLKGIIREDRELRSGTRQHLGYFAVAALEGSSKEYSYTLRLLRGLLFSGKLCQHKR